jgi:hypothetical protein
MQTPRSDGPIESFPCNHGKHLNLSAHPFPHLFPALTEGTYRDEMIHVTIRNSKRVSAHSMDAGSDNKGTIASLPLSLPPQDEVAALVACANFSTTHMAVAWLYCSFCRL